MCIRDRDITAGVSEDGTVDPRFKYEEPVTLTSYFEISPAITNWNQEEMLNCVYYQRQEEETNITIDWQWFAQQTENDSVPVSYTHLDVYKRQLTELLETLKKACHVIDI